MEKIYHNQVKFLNIDLEEEENEEKALTIIKEYLNCIMDLLWYFTINENINSSEKIKYYKRKNFVEIRNETFYEFGIKKINHKEIKYKESFDILNYIFEKNYKLI